jgi:hypothetical protein
VPDLTAQQVAILERLRERGFQIVAFPMYASYIGVRRGDCAALLAPVLGSGLQVFGEPAYLVSHNLSVRVMQEGKHWFVWKKEKLEATPARLEELKQFAIELDESLLGTT